MPTPLFAQLMQPETLAMAWEQAAPGGKTPGVDDVTLPQFERHLDRELPRLAREVREGAYHPWLSLRLNIPNERAARGLSASNVYGIASSSAPCSISCSRALSRSRKPARMVSSGPLCGAGAVHSGCAASGRAKWAARGDIRLCFDSLAHDRLQAVRSRVVWEKDVEEPLRRLVRGARGWRNTGRNWGLVWRRVTCSFALAPQLHWMMFL